SSYSATCSPCSAATTRVRRTAKTKTYLDDTTVLELLASHSSVAQRARVNLSARNNVREGAPSAVRRLRPLPIAQGSSDPHRSLRARALRLLRWRRAVRDRRRSPP